MSDRVVHAERDGQQIVRYSLAGKWYIESPGKIRVPLTIKEAVARALAMGRSNGVIHLDRPGGGIFSSRIRKQANGKENVDVVS